MAPKRPLGLGKAAKAKKHKAGAENGSASENNGTSSDVAVASELPKEKSPENSTEGADELTVELGAEIDANDAVGQLAALWRTYFVSEEKKELVLNGIIHECDRILRKANSEQRSDSDEENVDITGRFYAIYALALSNLAFFHTEEREKVDAFFTEAMERITRGEELFPDSVDLLFAKARIMINKIALTVISRLDKESRVSNKVPNGAQLLDECLAQWEKAEALTAKLQKYDYYNIESLDFLQALDDLLDVVDNFGHDRLEGEDSDADEEDEDDVKLDENHPLFSIRNTDKYNKWWRDHSIIFLENLDKRLAGEDRKSKNHPLTTLRRELCKRLGQSYLMEAEVPSNVFTTLTYYAKDKSEINGLTKEQAQKASQELFSNALRYLKDSQDDDEPETWVNVAEAMISLGNVHDLDSPEQEKAYKEAEEILTKANNATNGKFDDILHNLLQNQ
ncbi:hypothetical protein CJJ07_005563 [Candidozyma auris]|nr:hypothetical protein CJJ07_005563 [[Candida] auris]